MKFKSAERIVPAYFSVEAALVMSMVLACYLFVSMIMCFAYERCILEHNACRLSIWHEYVEGYLALYPENSGSLSTDEVLKYLVNRLDEAEENLFLFARDIKADVTLKGDQLTVARGFYYAVSGGWRHESVQEIYCMNPVEFIRMTNKLKDTSMNSGEETND